MTHRGGNLVKRTMPDDGVGKDAAASSLPLFSVSELDDARKERADLMHKLAHVSQDDGDRRPARSR